ncbi:MAG TPA: hypothetical protein VL002_10800 [Candidimonas sp.]|nr:hypothetical protein [Candidimonas sp.]
MPVKPILAPVAVAAAVWLCAAKIKKAPDESRAFSFRVAWALTPRPAEGWE